jgi:hypothetical protein
VNTWNTTNPREWTFGNKLITGYGEGIGEYGSSYALDAGSGLLLNGRISANLRLIRGRGVGAGLVCRADEHWNFVAFYTAPAEADAESTFARFGVYRDGVLTNIATSEQPIKLGTGYNRFSLEFFSGQLRGEIGTPGGTHELATACVEMPFPGCAGIVRLYGSGLMAADVVVQHTTIPLAEAQAEPGQSADDYDFDAFLCHSSADKDMVREIAKVFAAAGISYWLDEEQIKYGQGVIEKIEDGLNRSRYVIPCVSANLATSGWTRGEYSAILNAEFSGDPSRTVIPLVLDESDAENVPLLLRDKKRAYYINKTEFEHFLRFLQQRSSLAGR